MNSANLPEIFHPPINRAMKELDRSFFRKTIPTTAATIWQPKQTSTVRGALSSSHEMLDIAGLRPIVDDEVYPGLKCMLLRPDVKADQPDTWSDKLTKLVNDKIVLVRPYELTLTYDNWTMANILEAILPELPEDQKETPAGFAQAGHIAHINLRNQYLPYKHLIGQVLLDKNPTVRTVVNKTLDVGSESEFRTFPYEILAGDNELEVTQSEQGCEFRFNFAEVYWNSRLGTEHERLVAKFKPGQAVCDAMAGVGPFAVPAGRKKVFVRANDLNPHSYEGLKWAIQKNKVYSYVSASCADGRAFIKEATANLAKFPRVFDEVPKVKISRKASGGAKEEAMRRKQASTIKVQEPRVFDHYVLNLPASAVEFLDAFKGLYQGREPEFIPNSTQKLPMIHVYTFQARRDDPNEEVQEVCEKVSLHLGAKVTPEDQDIEVFDARLVAPQKKYYRVSFRLPAEVAFASVAPMTDRSRRQSRSSDKSASPVRNATKAD